MPHLIVTYLYLSEDLGALWDIAIVLLIVPAFLVVMYLFVIGLVKIIGLHRKVITHKYEKQSSRDVAVGDTINSVVSECVTPKKQVVLNIEKNKMLNGVNPDRFRQYLLYIIVVFGTIHLLLYAINTRYYVYRSYIIDKWSKSIYETKSIYLSTDEVKEYDELDN